MMESGALTEFVGTVAVNATWAEDIYFSEDGIPTDLTGLSFRMTFRRCDENFQSTYGWGWSYYNTSPDLTLSTDDGTLTITDDDDGNHCVLSITLPAGTMTGIGDYIADLASKDADDVITPWAHGRVTFRNNPPSWT